MAKSKAKRAQIEYVNESIRDGVKVLRLLIAAPTRGYTTKDLERVSGLPYDFCRRACFTLELLQLARKTVTGTWKAGDVRGALSLPLSGDDSTTCTNPTQDVMSLAESMR